MTSHEYAAELQKTIDHILSRPDVDFDVEPHLWISFWEKEKFVAAAKAMGTGKKEFHSEDLHFMPAGTCLTMLVPRAQVCRKIQDVKWECEPLFSAEEIISLDETKEEDQIF